MEKDYSNYIGKRVRITSSCEMFPGFNVTGKVLSVSKTVYGESLIRVKTDNGKTMTVGSSMRDFRVVAL